MKKGKRSSRRGSSDGMGVAGEEPAHAITTAGSVQPRIILNHAPPGAGKGTVATNLKELLPLVQVVSMSSLLEERARKDGGLVPSPEVNALLEDSLGGLKLFTRSTIGGRLVRATAPKMIFIDGWPREEEQARFCAQLFHAHDLIGETLVLDWTVPDSLSLRRQFGRWTLESAKPAHERRHDFVANPDEASAQHHHRLQIFRQNDAAIRGVLREAGFRFQELNASQKVRDVLFDFVAASGWMTIDEFVEQTTPFAGVETSASGHASVAA